MSNFAGLVSVSLGLQLSFLPSRIYKSTTELPIFIFRNELRKSTQKSSAPEAEVHFYLAFEQMKYFFNIYALSDDTSFHL